MDPLRPSESAYDLIRNAQGGNGEALGRLLERYRPGLRALVQIQLSQWLRRREEVDDLVQEVCLQAVQSLGGFKWLHTESFPHWLTGIALNVIKNRARYWKADIRGGGNGAVPFTVAVREREGMDPNEFPQPGTLTPMRAMAREERYERLVRAIESLSLDHRQAILLARIEGLPLQEVAARMGRSRDAVSMIIHRALEKLRSFFGSTGSFGLPARPLWPEPGPGPSGDVTEERVEAPEGDSPRPRRPETNQASEVPSWFENLPNVRSGAARIAGGLSWLSEGAGARP